MDLIPAGKQSLCETDSTTDGATTSGACPSANECSHCAAGQGAPSHHVHIAINLIDRLDSSFRVFGSISR